MAEKGAVAAFLAVFSCITGAELGVGCWGLEDRGFGSLRGEQNSFLSVSDAPRPVVCWDP